MAIDHYEEILFGSSLLTVAVTDDNPPQYQLVISGVVGGGVPEGGATEAAQDEQTALLTDIETAVDGLETLVGTTNTTLTTIDGRVDGLETLQTSANTKLDTLIAQTVTWSTSVVVTFTLDTSAFAAGDVLADTQVITNFTRVNDEVTWLDSIELTDVDDVGAELYIVILGANTSFGTENSAPSINDTNAQSIQYIIPVPASLWYDVGGAKKASVSFGRKVYPASGTRNLYVALWNGSGSPTFTANGIVGRFYGGL